MKIDTHEMKWNHKTSKQVALTNTVFVLIFFTYLPESQI
jgi:hypothetical protein